MASKAWKRKGMFWDGRGGEESFLRAFLKREGPPFKEDQVGRVVLKSSRKKWTDR